MVWSFISRTKFLYSPISSKVTGGWIPNFSPKGGGGGGRREGKRKREGESRIKRKRKGRKRGLGKGERGGMKSKDLM